MINKSKKLKFLQSREQWKTTNSNKEDNWSEMIQNLENEENGRKVKVKWCKILKQCIIVYK